MALLATAAVVRVPVAIDVLLRASSFQMPSCAATNLAEAWNGRAAPAAIAGLCPRGRTPRDPPVAGGQSTGRGSPTGRGPGQYQGGIVRASSLCGLMGGWNPLA